MCGIAGQLNHSSRQNVEAEVRLAVDCLQHRGPDGEGIWSEENAITLGHRRLAIIDLSPAAAQPFEYVQRYIIVHNGEIYNYKELRRELTAAGFSFRSSSDTEVLAAAYAHWGSSCLNRLEGMFAFAVWDREEKKLFLARDRFGEKPLFFFSGEDRFCFASEPEALVRMGIQKQVDLAMCYNFLTLGYTTNPYDRMDTFFTNIRMLPPASFLTISAGELPVVEQYWTIEPTRNFTLGESEVVETLRGLLRSSVSRRLRSDVKIGTSLSGGLDSSAIVALCDEAEAGNYAHECFTASFQGFEKDETLFASEVAERFGLRHHLVQVADSGIVDLMDKVMKYQQEPFGSASVLAQFKVYAAAKENGITVLLDGQGADELMAGYHHYFRWYWRQLYAKRQLKSSGELKTARSHGAAVAFSNADRLMALLPQFGASLLQARKQRTAARTPGLNREFASEQRANLHYMLPAEPDLNGILYHNSFHQGLGDLLRLADRNSMAHGTEVRLPFLDHKIAEFLFQLPEQWKIREGWTKWLLRKAVEDILPPSIVWRKDKIGFEPPQRRWMDQNDVKEAIRNGKEKLVRHGLLDPVVLNRHRSHHAYETGAVDWKYWSLSYLFS